MNSASRQAKAGASIWLAAFALLVRALLPGGYMFAPGAAGAMPEIRLCGDPAAFAALAQKAGHGEHDAPAPSQKKPEHCAFAFDGGAAPPAGIAPVAEALAHAADDPATVAPAAPRRLPIASPPPATGPPSLS